MSSATGAVTRTADRALIAFVRLLPNPVDDVWAALTDPAIVSRWMAPTTIDARPGGHIDIDFGGEGGRTTGTMLIFDPPRTLEHEWQFAGEAASVVRYDLAPDGADTVLTLTHRRLGTALAGGYAPGWHAYLDRLSAVLDGTDVPDWDERFAAVRAEYR